MGPECWPQAAGRLRSREGGANDSLLRERDVFGLFIIVWLTINDKIFV